MKNLIVIAILAISMFTVSCNQPIAWTAEMEEQITKQCLEDFAERFKAENPDEFCACFVGKMKDKEMGMMDLIKSAGPLATECGAQL